MSMLQEIFNGYINSKQYKGKDESNGALEAFEQCSKSLNKPISAIKDDMPGLIVDYGVEREELGFINGFCHGVQLMAECFPKNGGGAND